MSSSRADELVELLQLPADSRVLDVGCGKAEFLLRAVERYAAAGVGVDPNGEFLRVARANAAARGLGERMEWHEAGVGAVVLEPASFDLAICFGSSHAFGNFEQALAALAALVRPGGQVLIADPYWRKEPAAEYLAVLGAKAGLHLTYAGNEAAGLAAGLVPLYSGVSNADEWDSDAPPFRERIRAWREGYRQWGRDTLGFGFYLYDSRDHRSKISLPTSRRDTRRFSTMIPE